MHVITSKSKHLNEVMDHFAGQTCDADSRVIQVSHIACAYGDVKTYLVGIRRLLALYQIQEVTSRAVVSIDGTVYVTVGEDV